MKSVFLAVVGWVTLVSRPALAGPVLACDGGAGGPQPARVELTLLDDASDGRVRVHVELTNPQHPDGVEGRLSGQSSGVDGRVLQADGTIGASGAHLVLEESRDGRLHLSIYTRGPAGVDRSIEFGYGAHFSCR